jgi:toxin-antitoxin system PIN domain toxin
VKRALDTNVLVYAHLPGFAEHERVRAFLQTELRKTDVTLCVTPMVLHEFVHVITDPRRFVSPVTMSEAVTVARSYLGRENVECLSVNEDVIREALALLDRHSLGRKRIADTLLAATLLQNGVAELVTCNPQDFRLFEGLSVTDPTARPPSEPKQG